MAPQIDVGHYAYQVRWSPEDQEYVATTLEWGPGFSWLDPDPEEALAGLRRIIAQGVEDLIADGKPVPQPLADRDYSGRVLVRMPTSLHRDLTHAAAEDGVSLNQAIIARLAEQRHPVTRTPVKRNLAGAAAGPLVEGLVEGLAESQATLQTALQRTLETMVTEHSRSLARVTGLQAGKVRGPDGHTYAIFVQNSSTPDGADDPDSVWVFGDVDKSATVQADQAETA